MIIYTDGHKIFIDGITTERQKESFTITANSASAKTINATKAGYTPLLAIVEDTVDNKCVCYRNYLMSDGHSFYIVIQNNNNVQVSINVGIVILYKKV